MEYKIVRSKRKYLALQIARDATLVVRAPLKMAVTDIERFIGLKRSWIEMHQQRQLAKKYKEKKYEVGEKFWFLGEEYPFELIEEYSSKVSLRDYVSDVSAINEKFSTISSLYKHCHKSEKSPSLGRGFLTSVRNGIDSQYNRTAFTISKFQLPFAKRKFEQWYREQAKTILTDRSKELAGVMGVVYNKITITGAETRWGSCSSKGIINFAWKLIMAPMQIVNYVVIHELAHLRYHDHSKRFWSFVAQFDPDWKIHRDWLHENEHLYHL